MEDAYTINGKHNGKIHLEYFPCMNYAMVHNHISSCNYCELTNTNHADWSQIKITLEGELIKHSEVIVDMLPKGQNLQIKSLDISPETNKLIEFTERTDTTFQLVLTIDGEIAFTQEYPISLMAFDQWTGSAILPELLAALSVVQDRLAKIGLDPFCLEMHSNKATKSHFLEQLKKAIEVVHIQSPAEYKDLSKKLFKHRNQLIDYMEALHNPLPSGYSLYDCITNYLSIQEEEIPFDRPLPKTLDKNKIEAIRAFLNELDVVFQVTGHPQDHPLKKLVPKEASSESIQELQQALANYQRLFEQIMERKKAFETQLGLSVPDTFKGITWMKKLCDVLPKLPMLNYTILNLAGGKYSINNWKEYVAASRKRKQVMSELLNDFAPEVLDENAYTLIQEWNAIETRWFFRKFFDKRSYLKKLRLYNASLQQQQIPDFLNKLYIYQQQNEKIDSDSWTSEIFDILNKKDEEKWEDILCISELAPVVCQTLIEYARMNDRRLELVVRIFGDKIGDDWNLLKQSFGKSWEELSGLITDFEQNQKELKRLCDMDLPTEGIETMIPALLDDCIALSMPSRYLTWHYRSKHESLIAFSNSHYYDGKLYTFPSVDDRISKVSLIHVDGVYDKGHTRCNRAEADAIVQEIIRRLQNPLLCEKSIGVVSFSQVQQNLIEDLLLEELGKYPELEQKAFHCNEPVFIKNLENVQGDERDVILFSIGYGPDKNGNVSMNFGPLNNQGGERRLNVAVSRARYEMIIYSTLRPEQIDLKRTKAKGVKDLKRFLEFAKHGMASISLTQANHPPVNDLAKLIAKELEYNGYQVETCDGKNYYETKTTRDREIVQPDVLRMLHWNIMRIWSIDWFENQDKVMERIIETLENLQKEDTTENGQPSPDVPDNTHKSFSIAEESALEVVNEREKQYVFANLPTFKGNANIYSVRSSSYEVAYQLKQILSVEQPITNTLLYKHIAEIWSIDKITVRLRRIIDSLLDKVAYMDPLSESTKIYWANKEDSRDYKSYRINSNREIQDIPINEIMNAAFYIVEQQISIPMDDLKRATSKVLGFNRKTQQLDMSMEQAIRILIDKKRLNNYNGMISIRE